MKYCPVSSFVNRIQQIFADKLKTNSSTARLYLSHKITVPHRGGVVPHMSKYHAHRAPGLPRRILNYENQKRILKNHKYPAFATLNIKLEHVTIFVLSLTCSSYLPKTTWIDEPVHNHIHKYPWLAHGQNRHLHNKDIKIIHWRINIHSARSSTI